MTTLTEPTACQATINVCPELHGERLDAAWTMYAATFAEINRLAVQRHQMHRDEFDHVMTDDRVDKYVATTDDGTVVGLATYTNDLDAMPLISPAYFEQHFPKLYAERRIWYCGFVGVDRNLGPNRVFNDLVEAMYRVAAEQHGLIVLDICNHNDKTYHLPRAIRLVLHRLSGGVRATELDAQTFWAFDFPAAGVTV